MSEKMIAASNKPWNLRIGCKVISQANDGVRQQSKNSLVSLILRNSGKRETKAKEELRWKEGDESKREMRDVRRSRRKTQDLSHIISRFFSHSQRASLGIERSLGPDSEVASRVIYLLVVLQVEPVEPLFSSSYSL